MQQSNCDTGLKVRRAGERGHSNHGWLDSFHTFSFADYYDPNYMGFHSLRVINEDRVGPSRGFPMHPHEDMEILTYVISGALKHRDSMGHESVIGAGQIQKITAGSGISHSEFNASNSEKVHFLQIWVEPLSKGLMPSYQELTLPEVGIDSPICLIGAKDAAPQFVSFNQDVSLYKGKLEQSQSASYSLQPTRGAWVQMIAGSIDLNGSLLHVGDGACVEDSFQLDFVAKQRAEFLLFDLA